MTTASPRTIFDEGLAAGELRYQWCAACDAPVFYPRTLCPGCGGRELGWRTSAGSGSVYSTTTVAQRDTTGYNVALVDLDEGFRMMSTVLGEPAEVRIGDRVHLEIIDVEGQPTAAFRPGAGR